MAGPALGLLAAEDGLVERGACAGVAEPGGDLAELGAVGVVEVMARGEELDGAGTGAQESVELAGVESLGKEDVGGDSGLHGALQKYNSGGCGGFLSSQEDSMRIRMTMIRQGIPSMVDS